MILIDSGTFTYVGDPVLRDTFRGSAAHSTIRIDGHDQATSAGPFWWADAGKVEVRLISEDCSMPSAAYSGFVHRRIVRFEAPGAILVLDEIIGPPGVFTVEQFWQWRPQKRVLICILPRTPSLAKHGDRRFRREMSIPRLGCLQARGAAVRIAAAIDLTGELPVSVRELPEGAAFSGPAARPRWC